MKTRGAVRAVALLLLWLAALPAPGADAPMTPDLGRLPSLEDVAIAPGGGRIAYVRTRGDARFVYVAALGESGAPPYALRVADQKLRAVRWVGDDFLMVVASQTTSAVGLEDAREEWFQAQVIDVRTHKTRLVEPVLDDVRVMNVVAGTPMVRIVRGQPLIIARGYYVLGGRTQALLFWFDPQTGRSAAIDKAVEPGTQWLVDDDGAVAAKIEYTDASGRWRLRVRRGDRLVAVASGENRLEQPVLVGLSEEPGYAVVSLKDDDIPERRTLSLTDGTMGESYRPDEELERLYFAPNSSRIVGGYSRKTGRDLYFDPKQQQRWAGVAAAYAGADVTLQSATADGSKLVVLVDGPDRGYYYEIVDLKARRGSLVGPVYDGLTTYSASTTVHYRARDGLNLSAVLTLPRGRPATGLPLIVLPHGGPGARSTTRFFWWRQAYAAAGYAVLEPNYRGSDLSWGLLSAGFGEWGRKMQSDLSDGVRALADAGTVDAQRVCIVGASYGGYAALAGVALESGIYRCAASVAGPSDLSRMLQWTDVHRNQYAQRYWDRFMGVTGPSDPLLSTISPAAHGDRVSVPVLLVHGRDDTVVPYEQSEIMRDALSRAHRPVELLPLGAEDHWLSRSSTRSATLAATLAFLQKYNPAD